MTAWLGQHCFKESNGMAPQVRMQKKRFRLYCGIYEASKDRIVVSVSILSCYLTNMDAISVEDKEKWRSRTL